MNKFTLYFIILFSCNAVAANPVQDANETLNSSKSIPLENLDATDAFKHGQGIVDSEETINGLIDSKLRSNIENTHKDVNLLMPQLQEDISSWVEKSKANRAEAQLLIDSVRENQKSSELSNSSINATKDSVDIGEMVRRYGSASASMIKGEAPRESIPSLLVFVSLSMPVEMIELYGKQASAAGGVLVIRGLVGNSMRQTVAALQSLVDSTGVETLVDPTLYQRFKVSRVPTIILTDGVLSPCSPEEQNCDAATPVYDQVAGNVTLEYALSLFASSGQSSERAVKHLVPLQQSFVEQATQSTADSKEW